MNTITTRLEELKQALVRLNETRDFPPDLPYKESTVQRFEFTFELAWKVIQATVSQAGYREHGPKASIRAAAQLGIIQNPELWFEYLQDRNETTHMYKLEVLERVYQRVPSFIKLISDFIQATETYLQAEK